MLLLTEPAMPWKQSSEKPVSPRAKANAKALRRDMTEPEKRLWWHRRHGLPQNGTHFRRQVAVGPYAADFRCHAAKLIAEVDGGQHGTSSTEACDARRTTYLQSLGFTVIRFSNIGDMRTIVVVLDTIQAALVRPTPTPFPSPQGGGAPET